jgi:hypothetical protein
LERVLAGIIFNAKSLFLINSYKPRCFFSGGILFLFFDAEDAGKTAYVCCRYENRRGKSEEGGVEEVERSLKSGGLPGTIAIFTMSGGTIYGKAGSLPAGTDTSLANSTRQGAQAPRAGRKIVNSGNFSPNSRDSGPNPRDSRPYPRRSGYGLSLPRRGLSDSGIGPSRLGIGPNRSDVGPSRSGIGPNHSGVGPNHSGIGPNHSGIGPNHSGIGSNHSGIGPNRLGIGPNRRNVSLNRAAKWGAGGAYTKGGASRTGGSDIGSTNETLIAAP